tara:strand:- start:389 stop:1537 length:1149 start_codon:yes stop_codon:yes gene_type:complete
MSIKTIPRNKSVIDSTEDLEFLYKFENFPVFMGCTNKSYEDDILVDMQWEISKNSGVIQLNPLLPLEVLYQEFHGSGNIGGLWKEHHEQFAKFVRKQSPTSVLEIGGGHGILSKEYMREEKINWTIVEPNPTPVENVDAKFIRGFFDDNFIFNEAIDTIVHSHVFEHVYNPDEFMSHISRFLSAGQKLIFSIPKMEEMLKRKYTNCINFEHTVFLTEPYIEYILSKNGFRQVDKQYFKNDHSIFYAYVRDVDTKIVKLPNGLYEHNKRLYMDYIDYHNIVINELNSKINTSNEEQTIFLFGAHVFAQYLISFGLYTDKITCLLDNDPNKHKKRLYGTNLMVESPNVLKDVVSPIVILKAGIYNEEIKKDILENINRDTIFWE